MSQHKYAGKTGTSWYYVIELPTGQQVKRRGFRTKAAAKDAETANRADLSRTGYESTRITVGDYLDRWLADYCVPNLRSATAESYADVVRRVLKPALGNLMLSKLRKADIVRAHNAWRDAISTKTGRPLQPATVHGYHAVLSKALTTAVAWDILTVNPATGIKAPSIAREEMRTLRADEAQQLLAALEGSEWHPLVYTALATGMRIGELLGLTWSAVDHAQRTIEVRRTNVQLNTGQILYNAPKTKRGLRQLRMSADLADILRAHRKAQMRTRSENASVWVEQDLVFCDQVGQPITRRAVSYWFERACRSAGVSVRFHDLRHTFATLALARGENVKLISDMLGHSSISITADLYLHTDTDMQDRAMDLIADALRRVAL